ncbi:hypothetical protein ACWPM6_00730 [Propionibacterium freudenreichii]|uniref:hypothetical protein n=1 Tax=Propionibacterium freudenreichii TaxID=1744 RepID=UPI000543AF1F|nr:hypothetical protein [Propionibacterium freudenreichii]MDK9593817.1 hypothetical protein [Propionibacterium freudenreichii]WFF34981.1 hypothetical protein FAM19025_002207 [Propionibacterium freudenreichii]WFF37209.1 hypothetical protein FAM14221_002206 [Propionibacterium freudenreichii]CEH05955.1 Hypothetical protein PFCIRM134_02820 [Propionibacterium freudenreichii]SBN49756.1 Hypothetical protein PFR_JS8_153 [Propionibacterium freudenreichii]
MMHSRRRLVYKWVTITVLMLGLAVAIDVMIGDRRSDIEYLMWSATAAVIGYAGSFGHDWWVRAGFSGRHHPLAG